MGLNGIYIVAEGRAEAYVNGLLVDVLSGQTPQELTAQIKECAEVFGVQFSGVLVKKSEAKE